MATPVKDLETEALKLSEKDRAELARVLLRSLESLEDVGDEGNELAWAEEAERRYQEIKAGAVELIPSEDVFKQARSRLK